MTVNERTGHVLTLAVDSTWRRKGIGRDLLEVEPAEEDANGRR